MFSLNLLFHSKRAVEHSILYWKELKKKKNNLYRKPFATNVRNKLKLSAYIAQILWNDLKRISRRRISNAKRFVIRFDTIKVLEHSAIHEHLQHTFVYTENKNRRRWHPFLGRSESLYQNRKQTNVIMELKLSTHCQSVPLGNMWNVYGKSHERYLKQPSKFVYISSSW